MDKKKAMKSTDLSFNELIVFIDKELLEGNSISNIQKQRQDFIIK
jgi:hypothetical protein